MCSAALAAIDWFKVSDSVALWLEGIALILIFIWDRKDHRRDHAETIEQMKVMSRNAVAAEAAANAATKSADALINSERAWVIAELIPQALRFGGQWARFIGNNHVTLTTEELLAGHHLRYNLRFTNMGRTPAQIIGFAILYTCLGKDVTDLPENAAGQDVHYSPFELLLGDGKSIEIDNHIVDVRSYIRDDMDAIKTLEKTAVIHGWVKYRHMFSTADDCYADFCYSYTVSESRLSSVARHTKQRQEKTD